MASVEAEQKEDQPLIFEMEEQLEEARNTLADVESARLITEAPYGETDTIVSEWSLIPYQHRYVDPTYVPQWKIQDKIESMTSRLSKLQLEEERRHRKSLARLKLSSQRLKERRKRRQAQFRSRKELIRRKKSLLTKALEDWHNQLPSSSVEYNDAVLNKYAVMLLSESSSREQVDTIVRILKTKKLTKLTDVGV